jgi:hypothetical protein
MADEKAITISIYTHPELYPPVLNMIDELAGIFRSVNVVSRNLLKRDWEYPTGVHFITSGEYKPIRESEQSSASWKIKSFLKFTRDFYRLLKKERSEWVMCNDPISFYSFRLIRPWLGYRTRLWYQSHDVAELSAMRKYSIGYYAVKSERKNFHTIDLFTLPSESRLGYFPMNNLKGKWLLVPNYPSGRRTRTAAHANWESGSVLKLIYQGRISNEHGLDQLLDYVKTDPMLSLTIIGPGDGDFIQFLRNKTKELAISSRVSILGPVPYRELSQITSDHHVGLAINKPMNILYSTAAMASNKIYEYGAVGLPILYYKNEHYIKYLGRYNWAFPTDLSIPDLLSVFTAIRKNYSILSKKAIEDFKTNLNFESAFFPVKSFLAESIESRIR